MNVAEIGKWLAIAVAVFTAGGSWAVGEWRDDSQDSDIKELQQDKEQSIRVEERQKQIQKDVQDIKQLLEDIRGQQQ